MLHACSVEPRKRVPLHPLKVWLEERDVTQEEFGAEVGADQTYLSQIMRGKRRPSRNLALRISQATGRKVTVDQLLTYELPKGGERPKKRRTTPQLR